MNDKGKGERDVPSDHPSGGESPSLPAEGSGFGPCPFCKQYSHSLREDRVGEAFMHFEMMEAHPVRGHPMGHVFDAKTRDMAQVLLSKINELELTIEALHHEIQHSDD